MHVGFDGAWRGWLGADARKLWDNCGICDGVGRRDANAPGNDGVGTGGFQSF